MKFQELKKDYINGLLETSAFIIKSINEEPFTLRSGKKSYIYIDHSRVATSPAAYRSFIDVLNFLLIKNYKKNDFILCNVDSKMSAQIVGTSAYILNKPQIVYKSKKLTEIEKGTQSQLTGDKNWDLPVAILDDVMTGGDGTAKNVGELVLSTFPKIKDIQIFVGFVREAKKSTFKAHFAATRDELIDLSWNKLSDGQKQAVEKERKSK